MIDGIFGLVLGFIGGASAVMTIMDNLWQKEAIKRGFAEHDPKTGEWKWKEPTP